MYEGRTGAEPGIVFGHENMGIVDEVAPGVTVSARSCDSLRDSFTLTRGS